MRQVRVDRQVDLDVGLLLRPLALERGDRLADHPHVQVEADALDVAGLLAAEQVAGAPDLQVLHRHVHAGAQLGVLGDGGQPLVGVLGERLLRRVEEVRVRPLPAPADPAADLVQLGQAEQVGPLHDQGVGVRDVDAGLDDRGADQDVELLLPEADHDLLQGVLAHLAVRHRDPRLGHQLAQPAGRPVDRLDPVVQVEDLPVAEQLAVDGRRPPAGRRARRRR